MTRNHRLYTQEERAKYTLHADLVGPGSMFRVYGVPRSTTRTWLKQAKKQAKPSTFIQVLKWLGIFISYLTGGLALLALVTLGTIWVLGGMTEVQWFLDAFGGLVKSH